jgi:streptogramin lyase
MRSTPIRSCSPLREERNRKRHLLIATLLGIVMSAFDPYANADVYVCDLTGSSVLRFNEVTGEFIDVFVPPGSGGLDSPRHMLIGRDGNLYVTSFNTDSVMRYDGTTGTPLPAPGKTGAVFASGGGLQGPAGLIFGRDGNLYVSSRSNDRVLRYSGTTGDPIDEFVPAGTGGLHDSRGLGFGPDGNLYVSNGTKSVMRYDGMTGAPLPAPGQTGAVFASADGLQPASLVFGSDGNLYVANRGDFSVLRFKGATGEFMDTFVSPGSGGLTGVAGVLFGPDQNLYVCDNMSGNVLRFDGATGAYIDAFIAVGSGGLGLPARMFFTHTDPTTLAYGRGPANHFLITAAPTAVSGTPFDLTVSALGPNGNIDTNFQGTVTFSTSDADSGVVLAADYTFTTGVGGDNGVHTFAGGVTLVTLGPQTLTATDTVSGITGTATITVGPGP